MLTSAFAACVVFRGRDVWLCRVPSLSLSVPLVVASGPSLWLLCGRLLIAVAPHVEQRLQVLRRQQLWRVGWVVVDSPDCRAQAQPWWRTAAQLLCSLRIFAACGTEPVSPVLAGRFFTPLTQQGSPCCEILKQCINCFVPQGLLALTGSYTVPTCQPCTKDQMRSF